MTLAMTSAMAACKVGESCSSEADCKAQSKDYAIVGGKCVNPKAGETETQCAGIVSTSGAKPSAGSAADATAVGTESKSK